MMRMKRHIWRRFAKSTRGIAAVEFAMVLPILTLMFLAAFDGGRAIGVYMKVRTASYTLAAITNQYASINDAAMSGIFLATSDVLAPYSTSPLGLTVSQIAIDAKGSATVNWSSTQGGTARAVGSTITVPTNLDTPNSYLILSEVKYSYAPMFGYFNNGGAIGLSDSLYVTPRSTTLVARTSP